MRKLLLSITMLFGLVGAALAQEVTIVPDKVLDGIQEGDVVAIWNKDDDMFLYGKDNQNLGYDVAEVAFLSTNTGYTFKVEQAEGHYLFLLQTPGGSDYNIWGSLGYLNSQPETGWCSFILGLGDQWGADGENLALWDVEPTVGGFMLKNVGTGLYLNNALPAKYSASEAATWTFCTLKEKKDDEGPQKSSKGEWVSIISNGNLEGTEVANFVVALDAVKDQGTYPATIVDGAGVDGSRGIVVESMDDPTQTWQTQFFIKANDPLPAGAKIRLAFDYKADEDAECGSGWHAEPRDYKGGNLFGEEIPYFTSQWQKFDQTVELADAGLQSIAFDLNVSTVANKYYFDNIEFEYYKPMTAAEYNVEALEISFPYDTNLPALVKACGKTRLLFPTNCFTVTVNGQAAPISSVEATEKGRLYIFMNEDWAMENEMTEKDQVVVTFKNPTDEAFRIIYTEGVMNDVPADDFEIIAEYNEELDALPYSYGDPEVESANPEPGSFNVPNNIREFHLTFDRTIVCSKLKAYLGKEELTVSPADGFSKEITLTRKSTADLADGAYSITLENLLGENNMGEQWAIEIEYTFFVGKQEIDPSAPTEDLIAVSLFDECNENTIPEGFIVNFNDVVRTSDETYSDGPRMRNFSKCADFGKALYFTKGSVEYGSVEGHKLTLAEGAVCRVEFNSAMWKASGKWMAFQVLGPDGEPVVDEMIKNNPNMNEKTDAEVAANETTYSTFKFIAEQAGDYKLRWVSVNEDGKQGNNEVLLAKVHMYSMPTVPGWEEMTNLLKAIEEGKATITESSDERYAGEAFDALDAAVRKYDAEAAGYTAPSVCVAATADLKAKTATLSNHRTLCDTYDYLVGSVQGLVANNEETKFGKTDIFAQLKAASAKFDGKVLTDDAEMTDAIAELNTIVAVGNAMFTEGESREGDAGVKVLVERLRLGAETLLALGVNEEDELIAAINNAVTDDEELAGQVKNRIKEELYKKLAAGDNSMFVTTTDDEGNETQEGVDVTVFAKNPNIYALAADKDFSEENVPGWTAPIGNPDLFCRWEGSRKIEGVPEDCAFTTWYGNIRMEQTVADLPAGVYTVTLLGTDWGNQPDGVNGFVYVKTSDTLVPEEDEEEDRDLHFAQTTPIINAGGYSMEGVHDLTEITVTDGQLTFGIHFAGDSQYFFSKVRLTLTAPADGFDYAGELAGVKSIRQADSRNVYFDLQGRHIAKPTKGLYIKNNRVVVVK